MKAHWLSERTKGDTIIHFLINNNWGAERLHAQLVKGGNMAHQTYFNNMKDHTQTEMLAEFSDKLGKKQTLIDVEKEKAKLTARPLEGQAVMEVIEDA